MCTPVSTTCQDGVLSITLSRPEAYNALNLELTEALHHALATGMDPSIRAVTLTGAGKAFCGGGDVKVFAKYIDDGSFPPDILDNLHAAITLIATLPKPVIALVNGAAAGAGLSLALACDLTYVHERATATTAYTKIGLTPDGGMTYFLPRLVGPKKAMELILESSQLSADEGQEMGMFTKIIAGPEWDGFVQQVGAKFASGPTAAFARAKQLIAQSLQTQLSPQLEAEARFILESAQTQDFQEGIAAFLQKRAPAYTGN